jgi:hypothetical protein
VADDDLREALAAGLGPARAGGEHAGHVGAGLVEADRVAVELRHQGDVVEHGPYVEEFGVEGDVLLGSVDGRPDV